MSTPAKRKASGGEQEGSKKRRVDTVVGREWLLERVDKLEAIISAYLVTSGTILRFHADAQQIGATGLARHAPLHLQERLVQLREDYAWARAELEAYMHQILTVPPPNPPPASSLPKPVPPPPVSTIIPKPPAPPTNPPLIQLKLPQTAPKAVQSPIIASAKPSTNSAPSPAKKQPNPFARPKSIAIPNPTLPFPQAANPHPPQRPAPGLIATPQLAQTSRAPQVQPPSAQITHSSPLIISSPPAAPAPRAKPKPRLLNAQPSSLTATTSSSTPSKPIPPRLPIKSQSSINLTLPPSQAQQQQQQQDFPAPLPPPAQPKPEQQPTQIPNHFDYTDSQVDSMAPAQAEAILAQLRAVEAATASSATAKPLNLSFTSQQATPIHSRAPSSNQPQQQPLPLLNNQAALPLDLSAFFSAPANPSQVDFSSLGGAGMGDLGAGGMADVDMSAFDGLLGADEPEGGWEALLASLGPGGGGGGAG